MWTETVDRIAQGAIGLLMNGKLIMIFTFVFGIGFGVQGDGVTADQTIPPVRGRSCLHSPRKNLEHCTWSSTFVIVEIEDKSGKTVKLSGYGAWPPGKGNPVSRGARTSLYWSKPGDVSAEGRRHMPGIQEE